ncbi:hypothetical protein IQ264_10395 [Phormidium sp. LEGE 05292]|nr:hypothetical protein [Phormidium sp. LEGE 05292]
MGFPTQNAEQNKQPIICESLGKYIGAIALRIAKAIAFLPQKASTKGYADVATLSLM